MSKGIERRDFLKVLGVSGAGATLSACSGTQAAERLIPYVVQPDEIVPGLATWYRTTCRECPAGCGMHQVGSIGRALDAVRAIDVTEEECDAILGGNAERLLAAARSARSGDWQGPVAARTLP